MNEVLVLVFALSIEKMWDPWLGVSLKLAKLIYSIIFIIISLTQFIPITPLIIFLLLNKIWDVTIYPP
jgi:hypothetical protein